MKTTLTGKHLIRLQDWSNEDIETLMQIALELKMKKALNIPHHVLRDKTLFMLFFEESTRTRNAFESGMTQLGGHAIYLTPKATQIDHGETPKDTIKVLSRMGHGIGIRWCDLGKGNKYISEIAKWSDMPVFNMQDDMWHPTQGLADLLTIKEKFGNNLRGLKFVCSWTFAPKYVRPLSMPQELVTLMPRFGMDVTLAIPPEFKMLPEVMKMAEENAKKAGAKFEVVNDMDEAFKDADIVYPKSWGPLAYTRDEKEGLALIDKYPSWVVNEKRMELTKPSSIYMHCMPADRGIEVTDGVMDGPHSVIYDEAENRLHAHKALMAATMA
ncbi:MAG TPA: ornithine carbamoyltransferase [Bacillota bacterium]|jgi:N-acetylornithine carbamoyltransferase